jgi:hypothetical protein
MATTEYFQTGWKINGVGVSKYNKADQKKSTIRRG